MEDFFRVGVISSMHGVHGEVKVFPTTDDVKRFKSLKRAVIDTGAGLLPVEISQVRFFKNLAILKFKDLDSINDVEPYRKRDLLVKREDAVPLGPDEHFIADLIGLSVVTDAGEEFGTVRDILQTGANDVYVIEGSNKEYLFPAIRECIKNVDLDAKIMTVHIMDGLLEL